MERQFCDWFGGVIADGALDENDIATVRRAGDMKVDVEGCVKDSEIGIGRGRRWEGRGESPFVVGVIGI